MADIDELREFYADLFEHSREIEFTYGNKTYCFQPNSKEEDRFDLWVCQDEKREGRVIASMYSLDEILNSRVFDGKSFVEIHDDTIDHTYF